MAALQEKEFASPEEVGSAESAAVQAESSLQKASVGIRALKVSEERLALEEQDIKLAEAEIETSKISLETAKQRLKETKVYAPMAGIISDRLVQVGQIISSPTMNVSGGNALLVLSDLSRVFVLARVEESDIGSLQLGQAATITVDAFPDESFDGKVVRMAPMGEKLSNIVTFEVKIEVLDEAKSKLLPEMTADVEILVASRDDVLCVPSEVVQRRGAERFVMTPGAPGAPPNTVTIQTGVDDGTKTEILAGLNEGDTVLVAEFESSDDESGGRPGGPGGGMPGPPPF